jgi:hypothetical protein
MCADQVLEPWGLRFNTSHFYPADARRHGIRVSHPSYVTKDMIGAIFHGGLSKN